VQPDEEEEEKVIQFQFQLVRLQSPSRVEAAASFQGFNSNWFDYSNSQPISAKPFFNFQFQLVRLQFIRNA
jgi:hypothetical protein